MRRTADAGMGCEVQDDEPTMLWSKLCFLAPFALATTASEGSLGVIREDPGRWASLEQCVSEACAVGSAEGARSPRADPRSTRRAAQRFPSSMQKDVAAGRVLELDAILRAHPAWR